MRLDKFIAHATGLSRADVKHRLKAGAIACNGLIERKGATHIALTDSVTLDGQTLQLPGPRYYMLHKPAGVVCANSDAEHPTVFDCLKDLDTRALQIAGRLDIDTTGLVLLTDDGQWNHRITSPRHDKQKRYTVTTEDPLHASLAERFAEGIALHGERHACRPAELSVIDTHRAQLAISEGKYHQVKRMFAACSHKVTALHRDAVAGIELDENLQPGEYRALTAEEIERGNQPQ